MTASQVVPCGSDSSFRTTSSQHPSPTSSPPLQSSSLSPSTTTTSSIVLIPNLVWPETTSMDGQPPQQQQQQSNLNDDRQQQQYLKKVTLVPDPLAASITEEVVTAALSSTAASSTTTSTQSDRVVNSSEGYSSASSSLDNMPLLHVARALLSPSLAISSNTSSTTASIMAGESSTIPYASLPATSTATTSSATNNNTVAEFLYQLTKMLSDDNRDIIEWSNGKIEVHSPQKLESQVLHKYFRHSKFASFQRQLNYFGFRKLAGKGKMAPCSYVNDDTTQDLRSLLLIKRKASLAQAGKEKTKRKRDRRDSAFGSQGSASSSGNNNSNNSIHNSMVNPVLAGILQRSTLPLPTAVVAPPILSTTASKLTANITSNPLHPVSASLIHDPLSVPAATSSGTTVPTTLVTPQALAQAAVGKGIKHNLRAPPAAAAAPMIPTAVPSTSQTATTSAGVAETPSLLLSARTSTPPLTAVAATTSAVAPTLAPTTQQQQQQQPGLPQQRKQYHQNLSKGELLFLPDSQMSQCIQESLSQLTNNYKNSLNELKEPGENSLSAGNSAAGIGDTENDTQRSISPGGTGLFMLSRNSSLVDLAMLDVQADVGDDDDVEGSGETSGFLMPFVDFPHQELIPTDQHQQQHLSTDEQQQQPPQPHQQN